MPVRNGGVPRICCRQPGTWPATRRATSFRGREKFLEYRVERAHSSGAGTGESPYGIRLAARTVNQENQNLGMEFFLRYIRDHAYPRRQGVAFRIRTSTATYAQTLQLENITYTLEFIKDGKVNPGFQITLYAEKDFAKAYPRVDSFNPEVLQYLPNSDELPFTMPDRFKFMRNKTKD